MKESSYVETRASAVRGALPAGVEPVNSCGRYEVRSQRSMTVDSVVVEPTISWSKRVSDGRGKK